MYICGKQQQKNYMKYFNLFQDKHKVENERDRARRKSNKEEKSYIVKVSQAEFLEVIFPIMSGFLIVIQRFFFFFAKN